MKKIGSHRAPQPSTESTSTTPSTETKPKETKNVQQQQQEQEQQQSQLTHTDKTQRKGMKQLSGVMHRIAVENKAPQIGSHRKTGPPQSETPQIGSHRKTGPTQPETLIGKTQSLSARNAPPNTILDHGRSRGVDPKYDGAFVGSDSKGGSVAWSSKTDWTKLEGIKPNNGKPTNGKCLYVNGMNTSLSSQVKSMQEIANSTGHEVVGIHNSTHGAIRDVGECIKDKMNIGNNGSHKTLTDTIYNHVKSNPKEPLNLVCHSQGGIITSRALRDVKNRLRLEDGMSNQQVNDSLKNVRIQTCGAAAVQYPGGPQYLHHVNTRDPVPQAFGGTMLGGITDDGKHGPVNRFTNPKSVHSMNSTYAQHLVRFDNLSQAQKMA